MSLASSCLLMSPHVSLCFFMSPHVSLCLFMSPHVWSCLLMTICVSSCLQISPYCSSCYPCLHVSLSLFMPPYLSSCILMSKALRMAFFSVVSVQVRNTSKPFLGFMTSLCRFLVACTRLYTLPCRLVGRSIDRSVRLSHL